MHVSGNGHRIAGRDYYELRGHVCAWCPRHRRAQDLALARWFLPLALVLALGAWELSAAPLVHAELGPWPRLVGYLSAAFAVLAAGVGAWGWVGWLRDGAPGSRSRVQPGGGA